MKAVMTMGHDANPRRTDVLQRSMSVFAGVLMMVSIGSNHSISAWNAQLKALLNYSQVEISLVCSMASFGCYFSVTSGYIFDHIGAHNSVLLGGLLLSFIHFAVAYGILAFPASMHPILVGLSFAIVGQASNFGTFAAIGPNEGLFGEDNRGKIMSLQFAAFSAGGALFAFLFRAALNSNVPRYFEFMGATFLIVYMFGWFATYRHPTAEVPQANGSGSEIPTDIESLQGISEKERVITQGPQNGPDITGRELLMDCRFWLLFSTVFILVGAALFIMANIAFIVESLGGPKDQISLMVAMFSIGNCGGRLIAGAISDHIVSWFPRVYFISVAAVFIAANHTLLMLLPPTLLIVPITLTGVADGIMFAIFPVLTRETFGLRHFGKNFGLMSVANAFGFPLFYSPIGSYVYKLSSVNDPSGKTVCVGAQCFHPVFVLVIALSCVAFVASINFAKRQQYMTL